MEVWGGRMATKYLELMFTDSVRQAQRQYYGRTVNIAEAPERNPLSRAEAEFIAARDSFYMSTVSETGWPYIQHRGGPRGFLRVVNEATLAFADYQGNRQLLTAGNISVNDRVALFLMDYKNQERLKIVGYARVEDARAHPELVVQLADSMPQSAVERLILIDVVSFNWNCPKHITPRYSVEEVEGYAGSLKKRIAELETELRAAKAGSGFSTT